MQAPIVTVMEYIGWLDKGNNLSGKKLDPFVRANSHPETGFFKDKILDDQGLPITRVAPRMQHISDFLSKYKFDNPRYDICTVIAWVNKEN